MEHCHAACELGQTFLEFLAVVVAGCGGYLSLNLSYTGCDGVLVAVAVDDGGVLFRYGDGVGMAEVLHGGVCQLETLLFRDDSAAGEDGDVLEHFLAAVAESGSLHGAYLQ